MKNYLSFGGGVNSTAMYFLMQDQGVKFEAIHVDHDGDWPETKEYVRDFAKRHPLTILTPMVEGETKIWDYCLKYKLQPSRMQRWCTHKFKVGVLLDYVERPCFQLIGIDAGEIRRAKMSLNDGIEHRYPLIEENIDRQGCVDIIKKHGEEVPMKSGCWFCPFQRVSQWRQLRRKHPDLFCKAQKLEVATNEHRKARGKTPIYLRGKDSPLINVLLSLDKQRALPGLEDLEYPPCECGL